MSGKHKVNMPKPFLQRHLEEFQMAMEDYLPQGRKRYVLSVYRGAALRAAASLGWVEGLEPEQVGNLPPAEVVRLADEVLNTVADVLNVAKKGS